MDSSYIRRIEKLESADGSGQAAQVRTAAERFAERFSVDLSRPEIREFLEGEIRAGRVGLDGVMTWEIFKGIFEHLRDLSGVVHDDQAFLGPIPADSSSR